MLKGEKSILDYASDLQELNSIVDMNAYWRYVLEELKSMMPKLLEGNVRAYTKALLAKQETLKQGPRGGMNRIDYWLPKPGGAYEADMLNMYINFASAGPTRGKKSKSKFRHVADDLSNISSKDAEILSAGMINFVSSVYSHIREDYLAKVDKKIGSALGGDSKDTASTIFGRTIENFISGFMNSHSRQTSYSIYIRGLSSTEEYEAPIERYIRVRYEALTEEWFEFKRDADFMLGHWVASLGLAERIYQYYTATGGIKETKAPSTGPINFLDAPTEARVVKMEVDVSYEPPTTGKSLSPTKKSKPQGRKRTKEEAFEDRIDEIMDKSNDPGYDYYKLESHGRNLNEVLGGDLLGIGVQILLEWWLGKVGRILN